MAVHEPVTAVERLKQLLMGVLSDKGSSSSEAARPLLGLIFAGAAILIVLVVLSSRRSRATRGARKTPEDPPAPPKLEPQTFEARADAAALPAHLRLGIALEGLQTQLPDDAAATRCERLQQEGSAHVGEPTVFVSHNPELPAAKLAEALQHHVGASSGDSSRPLFWLHEFCTREGEEGPSTTTWLAATVGAIRHTLLVLEESPHKSIPALSSVRCVLRRCALQEQQDCLSPHAPTPKARPLSHARCVYELYQTQRSGGRLSVAMPEAEAAAFAAALQDDFGAMQARAAPRPSFLDPRVHRRHLHQRHQRHRPRPAPSPPPRAPPSPSTRPPRHLHLLLHLGSDGAL